MFVGEFSHTIDNKGRLIIPSKFREEIGDQKLIVVPWWEENLSVFTQEGFREYVKSLDSLQGTEADVQKEITETLDESNFAITIVAYQTKADRNGLKPEVINDISRRYPSATHYTVANLPLFNIICPLRAHPRRRSRA